MNLGYYRAWRSSLQGREGLPTPGSWCPMPLSSQHARRLGFCCSTPLAPKGQQEILKKKRKEFVIIFAEGLHRETGASALRAHLPVLRQDWMVDRWETWANALPSFLLSMVSCNGKQVREKATNVIHWVHVSLFLLISSLRLLSSPILLLALTLTLDSSLNCQASVLFPAPTDNNPQEQRISLISNPISYHILEHSNAYRRIRQTKAEMC